MRALGQNPTEQVSIWTLGGERKKKVGKYGSSEIERCRFSTDTCSLSYKVEDFERYSKKRVSANDGNHPRRGPRRKRSSGVSRVLRDDEEVSQSGASRWAGPASRGNREWEWVSEVGKCLGGGWVTEYWQAKSRNVIWWAELWKEL